MTARSTNPWTALSALCIGFFMILLDTTIVSVAIPSMLRELDASLNSIVWVMSVYLLTYAVPMLVTSRLGDRFGPKRLFLLGLVVFTGSSLWCGLSGSAEMLIAARAVQGLGAAIMTPQTLSFITHLFPPAKRGAPMGVWGGVAGLATIAGPLLGGVLVEQLGWEWIFFVNVPIGVVAIAMTLLLVPDWQPRHSHSFDIPGIVLSCAGMFGLVFGIQNGQQYDWGTVWGVVTIPRIIGAGGVLLIAFVVTQYFNRREPLLPLRLFASRNFSTGSIAAATIGFAMTGMFLPLIIYIQSVLGFSPLMSGVLTAPMSLLSGIVAPFIGRLSDRISGKWLVAFGLVTLAAGLGIVALQARPDTNPWTLVPAFLVCGLGVGCIFSPLSNVTMSALEPRLAGAGSGVFNTARQVGGVLGSAAIGVLLEARISATMHDAAVDRAAALPAPFRQQFIEGLSRAGDGTTAFGASTSAPPLPPGIPSDVAARIGRLATEAFHTGFTDAARQTLLLPAAVLVLGALACLIMKRTASPVAAAAAPSGGSPSQPGGAPAPGASPVPVIQGVVRHSGGQPVDGATLTLLGPDGEQVLRGTTGTDGGYRLHPPAAAGYVLIASAPAYRPRASNISVNGEPVRQDIDLDSILTALGGVTGTVRAVSGASIAGATVTVTDSGGEVVDAQRTDEQGRYRLSALPPGTYTLVAGAPGHQPAAQALPVGAADPLVVDIRLATANVVRGAVRRSVDGQPVPDARVTVIDARGQVVRSAMTGEAGDYSLINLPNGEYTLIASGYPPVSAVVRLTAGEPVRQDIVLDHGSGDEPAGTDPAPQHEDIPG